jgi:hypothetical protein
MGGLQLHLSSRQVTTQRRLRFGFHEPDAGAGRTLWSVPSGIDRRFGPSCSEMVFWRFARPLLTA